VLAALHEKAPASLHPRECPLWVKSRHRLALVDVRFTPKADIAELEEHFGFVRKATPSTG
jgi:hypothetical protein